MINEEQARRTLLVSVKQNQASNSYSTKTATSAQLLEHITPLPLGEGLGVWLEGAGSVAALYNALSTCSLICSSSSFIFTTMFCISA